MVDSKRPIISLDAIREESRRPGEPTMGELQDALQDLRDSYRIDPRTTEEQLRDLGWTEDDIQRFVKMMGCD